MCPKFRYRDGKVLGTLPHPTHRLTSTHCVQILILSKGPLICYSELTHNNMHLIFKHGICHTLILIHSIKPHHSYSNIYPRAASTSQNRNINKALIIKHIHHVHQSRNLTMFTNQIKCMFMQSCMTCLSYLIAPQYLCINACSCSYACSCFICMFM